MASPVGAPTRRAMEKKVGTMDIDETLSAGRDWSALSLDTLALIFGKLGVGGIEILMGAGLVCHSWLQAAMVPQLWRSVDMTQLTQHKLVDLVDDNGRYTCDGKTLMINCEFLLPKARVAVDRSAGQLEVFLGKVFVNDELLKYIADRSPALKTLSLITCDAVTNQGFAYLIAKCPMLEDLKLHECNNLGSREIYQATAKACPQLKRFTLCNFPTMDFIINKSRGPEADGVVEMHELRSLTLVNCNVPRDYLVAILDGCPHLEHLDLHLCFVLGVDAALKARCAAIKSLMLY